MFVRYLVLALFISLLAPQAAIADENIVKEQQELSALKKSFKQAWEDNIRSLPDTIKFEKTDEPNIYEVQITSFPYSGKLKLNNIYISKKIDYYYDYDLEYETMLKGVAEYELLDIEQKDLYRQYPHSSQQWAENHYLFYETSSNTWLTAAQWKNNNTTQTSQNAGYNSNGSSGYFLCGEYKDFIPLIVLLTVLLILVISSRKTQKKYSENFDLSLERQKEAIQQLKQQTKLLEEITKNKDDT